MTAYCTQAELELRFGAEEMLELTDRDADGVADAGVLDGAIADASATIDSYIFKYDLPLPSVPPALTKIACDLVRYDLHLVDAPDRVSNAYKAAIKQLQDIAAGRAQLDIAGSEPAGEPDEVIVEADTSMFNRDLMKGF